MITTKTIMETTKKMTTKTGGGTHRRTLGLIDLSNQDKRLVEKNIIFK